MPTMCILCVVFSKSYFWSYGHGSPFRIDGSKSSHENRVGILSPKAARRTAEMFTVIPMTDPWDC